MPELIIDCPMVSARTFRAKPITEMGGQGVEVPPQPIGHDTRYTLRGESFLQIMRYRLGIFIFPPSQVQ
jgi:hypothetical protein